MAHITSNVTNSILFLMRRRRLSLGSLIHCDVAVMVREGFHFSTNSDAESPISLRKSRVRTKYSQIIAIINYFLTAIAFVLQNILAPFASLCGCVNRTSHPCGSSGSDASLFRPGSTAAPEASRYRHASNWWAVLWLPIIGSNPWWLAFRAIHFLQTNYDGKRSVSNQFWWLAVQPLCLVH
jgi:hypothetical protein